MNCCNIAEKLFKNKSRQNFQQHLTNLHKSFNILDTSFVNINSLNMLLCKKGYVKKIYNFVGH